MRAAGFTPILGGSALLLGLIASSSAAQNGTRQRAPVIRVYSQSGADVIGTSTYVEPAIDLSENAYVFAVSIDLDGHIQVLHPSVPGISVRLLAHREFRLPNFFAGFAQQGRYGAYSSGGYSGYYGYDRYDTDSRGTVIALASRAPFNLELIEIDGDWNISEIRGLIQNRTPQMAAQALAAYLGAKGEPIGRDFMRFAGGRSYNYGYAFNDFYSPCGLYYGAYAPALGFRQFLAFDQINRLRRSGQQVRILGYDVCGVPIFIAERAIVGRFPNPRAPRVPADTTVFPKGRLPQPGTPRHPKESGTNAAAQGFFPLPQRPRLPQTGGAPATAPSAPRDVPLTHVFEDYRPQRGAASSPAGRMPIERSTPPRVDPVVSASPPVREYRPEPRVESPPPARVPDRPREYSPPAPVVHERPSTPPPPVMHERPSTPPPAPRVETPKSEPARVPPPHRK
jgi:hypothetical protein